MILANFFAVILNSKTVELAGKYYREFNIDSAEKQTVDSAAMIEFIAA